MGRSDTGMTTEWTEGKPWEIARGERSDTGMTTGWTEGKPCEIAWGELRWEGAIQKRQEGGRGGNRGKKLGESSIAKERYGSDDTVHGMETVGNIAWGQLRWEGTGGSNDWVDGEEAVGNSIGRAPMGRSDTGVTRGWTKGKAWGIACMGRASVGRTDTGVTTGWTEGKPWEIAWGELRWEGAEGKLWEIAWGELQWEGAIRE